MFVFIVVVYLVVPFLYDEEPISTLKRKFAKVRALCSCSYKSGKVPLTWSASNSAENRKETKQ